MTAHPFDICAIKLINPEVSVRNVIDGSDKQIPTSDFIEKCRTASSFVTEQGVPNPALTIRYNDFLRARTTIWKGCGMPQKVAGSAGPIRDSEMFAAGNHA